jgi:hypothetical protein
VRFKALQVIELSLSVFGELLKLPRDLIEARRAERIRIGSEIISHVINRETMCAGGRTASSRRCERTGGTLLSDIS